MAEQGGYGLDLKMDLGTASLVTVAKVLDIDFPEQKSFVAEKTSHGSTGGYYEAIATGKKRLMPMTLKLGWDQLDAGHAEILTVFGTGVATDISIEDSLAQEVIAFKVIVESIGRVSPQEDLYVADVMLHPTGAPTIS